MCYFLGSNQRVQRTELGSLGRQASAATLSGRLSTLRVLAELGVRRERQTRNSRPNPGTGSVTPASRRQCQASAWLLEVTGLPNSASSSSTMFATRSDVQDTNTPSTDGSRARSRTASLIESWEMHATSLSFPWLKEPITGTAMPRFDEAAEHLVDLIDVRRQQRDALGAQLLQSGDARGDR